MFKKKKEREQCRSTEILMPVTQIKQVGTDAITEWECWGMLNNKTHWNIPGKSG